MDSFYQIMKQLKLTNQPIFTVSTLKKVPLNAKLGLKYHFADDSIDQWNQGAGDPESDLVTLNELYHEPNTPLHQIAMHADVNKTHVLLVDLEKDYDPTINQYLKDTPIVYAERSRHGGIHLLIKIDDELISNLDYELLLEKTVIKTATLKDKTHTGAEFFFNNHYLTFTKHYLKNAVNPKHSAKKLLDYLLKLASEKQQITNDSTFQIETEQGKPVAPPTDALVVFKHINEPLTESSIQKQIDKFNDADNSKREFQQALALCNHIQRAVKSNYTNYPILTNDLIDEKAPYQTQILIWVLILMMKKYVPERQKWHRMTLSTNKTYLQSLCEKVTAISLQDLDLQNQNNIVRN